MRMHVRRLACLPLEDKDAIDIIEGSEYVTLYLAKRDFFEIRAARRSELPILVQA